MLSYYPKERELRFRTKKGLLVKYPDTYPAVALCVRRYFYEYPEDEIPDTINSLLQRTNRVAKKIEKREYTTKYKDLFLRPPYEHQIDAIEHMLHIRKLALLLEQGLGKTYITCMTLRIMKAMGENVKALVICPRIVLGTWMQEIKLTGGLDAVLLYNTPRKKFELPEDGFDIAVTSYDTFKRRGAPKCINTLVLDEASRVIHYQSQRTQAVLEFSKKMENAWILSGTLCTGKPIDLYAPMCVLDERIIGMPYYQFMHAYCIYGNPYIPQQVTGYRNLSYLKALTRDFMISKTRAECIDMPDRIIETRYYELSPKQRRIYNEIVDGGNDGIINIEGKDINITLPVCRIVKLMQVLSGFIMYDEFSENCADCPKLMECVENGTHCDKAKQTVTKCVIPLEDTVVKLQCLQEDIEDTTGKIIIWAWYRHELAQIQQLLTRNKIGFVVAGSTDCVEKFNNNDNIRVFLGQTAQGIGITLNSAQTTIYYSHGCALEPRLQSMDRNYRIGQTNNVLVRDYVCKGSVDEDIVALLREKKNVMQFMQSMNGCLHCSHKANCEENHVNIFGKGCKFEGSKVAAETIHWRRKLDDQQQVYSA
jgi:SNF2 family DNA or RNA helicase